MEPERTGPASSRLWALLPPATFLALVAVTYGRWVIPFQDSGREMMTPVRLAAGERLYRDVGTPYGPLPALLDAAVLRLSGVHLDHLIALRVLVGLLGVEALRRLACRLTGDLSGGAVLSAFAVAACSFGLGGAAPFPYSVAALEGAVGTWWAIELALGSTGWRATLLAGALAGLAAGTKVDVLPAALLAPALALWLRRPRREALAGAGLAGVLAAAAYATPIALYGVAVVRRHGFLLVLAVPESVRILYERHVLYGGLSAADFRSFGWVEILVPSVPYLAIAALLAALPRGPTWVLGGASLAWGLGSAGLEKNEELNALIGGAILIALATTALALFRRDPDRPARAEWVAIGVAAALAASRQPFFLRNPIYGAFSAPLALVVALGWILHRVPRRAAFTAFLLGLLAAQGYDRWVEYRHRDWTLVDFPRARLYLPPEEADFVVSARATVLATTPPGSTLAAFPEPGFLTFVADRKAPFVDGQFLPGLQDAVAEDEMIASLVTRMPPLLLVTNRTFREYGPTSFGRGTLDRFFRVVGERYQVAGEIGGPRRVRMTEGRAAGAALLRPRPSP